MPKRSIGRRIRPKKEVIRSNNVVVRKPTSKSTWKSFEREVAKHFGTKRVPLSGSNSGHNTNSDTLHPKLYIECKVRGKSAIWTLFEDTRNKAKVEKKFPLSPCDKKEVKDTYWLYVRKICIRFQKYSLNLQK